MSICRKFERESVDDVHARPLKRPDAAPMSPASTADAAAPVDNNEGPQRRDPAAPNEPLPHAAAWAEKLPPDIRPVALQRSFVRNANFLVEERNNPAAVRPYIDELLIDRRGNRRGFPEEVLIDLVAPVRQCGQIS